MIVIGVTLVNYFIFFLYFQLVDYTFLISIEKLKIKKFHDIYII